MSFKEDKMLKILILGGSGFVSKSLAIYLINRGYEVDILTRGLKKIDYSGYKNHIVCDRTNITSLKASLKDSEYDVIYDISGYTKNDIDVLFQCVDPSLLKRYIFCSSAAVYIPSSDEVFESSAKDENSTWGSYGFNKLEAENYIFSLIENKGLHATIFRPSYIYGEGNDLYREAYFFDKILSNEEILIPDDTVKVQFIHIQDLVKVFECAIYNDNDNRAYNLTSPARVTFEELINLCGKIANKTPIIKKVPLSDTDVRSYFPFRSVDFNFNIGDLRENGFHLPVIYLEDGLKLAYNWYIENNPKFINNKLQ